MPRQFSLTFGNESEEGTARNVDASEPPSGDCVQAIAESLRPRLIECLRDASDAIELSELRNVLGFPGQYGDRNPQGNPVNRLVKQMRDAGELIVCEFDRSSPLVSLPEPKPSAEPLDRAAQEQPDGSGDDISSPERFSDASAPPTLVRPDRQCTFDRASHEEWPPPEEDRNTITVDRLYDDIDGASHRFSIRRGDTVEVFFRRDKVDYGEVVGISLTRREVRVRFSEGAEGIWFAVGLIYPALEE